MTKTKRNWIIAIAVLSLLVFFSGMFILVVTYAGSVTHPDASVTYTKHNLKWNAKTKLDENGSAILNIFGDPKEGEELPLIQPGSEGEYFVRLNNHVLGNIGYTVYLYCDNPYDVPLRFSIERNEKMLEADSIPKDLENATILDSVSGKLGPRKIENFHLSWHWRTDSDEADTALGNKAAEEEVRYTIHMLIVVEDNNSYYNVSAGGDARLLHRAYMYGYPEGDFRPDGNATRAEASAIFARILANYDETIFGKTKAGFSDVDKDSWFAKYVSFLEGASIINGYPDGSFAPNNSITRAEFVAICVRYFENAVGEIDPADIDFTDLDESHWCYELIAKAVAQGYLKGYPDGDFRPDAKITRAEVVTIVNRLLERVADKEFIDRYEKQLMQFTDLEDNSHWAYYDIHEAANTHHIQMIKGVEKWIG